MSQQAPTPPVPSGESIEVTDCGPRPSPSRDSRKIKGWLLAAVLLGCLFVWASRQGRKDLLSRAHRIPATQGQLLSDRIYSGYFWGKYHYAHSYFWLNHEEILIVRTAQNGVYENLKCHVLTGKTTRLPYLDSILKRPENEDPDFLWQNSPDGKWLLVLSGKGKEALYKLFNTEGVERFQWRRAWHGNIPVWLHDSSGFIEWDYNEGERLARVQFIGDSNQILVPLPAPTLPVRRPQQTKREGWVLISSYAGETLGPGEMARVQHGGADGFLQTRSFPIPKEIETADWAAALSPLGTQIAWMAYFKRRWPQVCFEPKLPFVRFEARHILTLWISDADGSNMRELGHLKPGEEFHRLSWTPDGRLLSFVFNEALWIIPIE